MKNFLLFALIALLSACTQMPQQTTQVQQVTETVEARYELFAVVEFGTNSAKGSIYKYFGAGQPVEKLKGKIKNGYAQISSGAELIGDLNEQVAKLATLPNVTSYYYVSSGFQNTYPDLAAELAKVDKRVVLVTPEEEAKWEWAAATSKDVNAVCIGAGGGSIQVGTNRSEKNMTIAAGSQTLLSTKEQLPTLNSYLTGKDKIFITGGAAYLIMYHSIFSQTAGMKENGKLQAPVANKAYTYEDFLIGLAQVNDQKSYQVARNAGIPDFDIPRNEIYATGLVVKALIEQIGSDKPVVMAPRRSWSEVWSKHKMESRF